MNPKNCTLSERKRWLLLGCNNSDKQCIEKCEYKKRVKLSKRKLNKLIEIIRNEKAN
jgi:hypothetical protein